MRFKRGLVTAVVALALTAGAAFANEMSDALAEADDHCVVWDGTTPVVAKGEEPSHGAYVCGAAKSETPDGFANHGEWVNWVAHSNYVDDETAEEPTDEVVDPEVDEPEAVEDPSDPEEEGDKGCLDWSEGVPVVEDGEEPNHGAYVCGAAHADWQAPGFAALLGLDEEFRNKGEFMRWVAHRNYVDEGETTEDEAASQGNGHGNGNGHGKDKAKGKGRP